MPITKIISHFSGHSQDPHLAPSPWGLTSLPCACIMGPKGLRRERSSGVGLPGGMMSGDCGSPELRAGGAERQQERLRAVHAPWGPSRSAALGGQREGCRGAPLTCRGARAALCSVRLGALRFCSFPCEAGLQRGARSSYLVKNVGVELRKGFGSLGWACSSGHWWVGGRRMSWEELDPQPNRPLG